MEILKIHEQIKDNILLLRKTRDTLKVRADDKSKAIAEYEKAIAIITIRLVNGEPIDFEGMVVQKPPATIMKDIVKGICYKERIAADLTESNLKSAMLGLKAIETTIMALQSLLKHEE